MGLLIGLIAGYALCYFAHDHIKTVAAWLVTQVRG